VSCECPLFPPERAARRRRLARAVVRLAGLALFVADTRVAQGADMPVAIPQSYRSVASGLPVVPFGVGTGARRGDDGAIIVPPLHWEVRTQDGTLEHTLQRWAALAGYCVEWDTRRKVPIAAPGSYEGTFEAALQTVLDSTDLREGDDPLEACIYASTPPLVRITRRGEQARECSQP